jgi:CSLREA domain-containing protein
MRRELGIIGCIVALLVGGFGFVTPSYALAFTVNTTVDTVDAVPGDGLCRDATGKCSLRAAIMEVNKKVGADMIILPAGTFKLTIAGANEELGAKGDLDVTSGPQSITGASAATTIVDGGTTLDRVFDVRNKSALTLSKLTVQNGKAGASSQDNGGGGIRATGGSSLTLSSVTVQNNTSPFHGAGILFNFMAFGTPVPAKLTIIGATITHNVANRNGGGIALGGGSTLVLQTTKVISNTARGLYDSSISQYGGGGLFMASGFTPFDGPSVSTTATLLTDTFDDNLARGQFAGDGWGGL